MAIAFAAARKRNRFHEKCNLRDKLDVFKGEGGLRAERANEVAQVVKQYERRF